MDRTRRTMRVTAGRTTVALGVAAVMAMTTGCGGSGGDSAANGDSSSSVGMPSTTVTGPDPNAPEIVAPGDIPDDQVFTPYQAAGGFKVAVPEGWARTDVDANHVAFSDKYNTIDLTWSTAENAPTEKAVSTELGASAYPGLVMGRVSSVNRAHASGILASYHRTSAPNAVTDTRVTLDVEQYEFWQRGKLAVVTLSGATGSDNVDPWRTVTDGFEWTT